MSAPSPLADGPSLVTFTIKVDGETLDSAIQVESIDTWVALNRVPRARIVVFDGSPVKGTFELSEGSSFVPGNEVSIAAGYDNTGEEILFQGVIVKQGIEISRDRASKMIIEVADEAIRMTLERKNGVFEKIKDSQLIDDLITSNKLKATVTSTAVEHEEIVQYYAADWDLMMTRAEVNGMIVRVEQGEVTVEPPNTSQSAALTVSYGDSILDLSTEMNAANQLHSSAIKSTSWDPAEQKLIESGPGSVNVTEPGDLSSEELADVFNIKAFLQQTGGPIEKASLESWSSAELLKSRLSKIRGRVRFQGSSLAVPGKPIELQGLGASFNGKAFMSGVHHDIRCGAWTTTVELGLSARWFATEAPHLAAPEASGLLPPISGLQTGTVKQVAKDPGGEYRVFVALPILGQDSNGVWARLGSLYASNQIGAVFYPELDDEVIVAFMNEDPRYPVILGSVYSKTLPPPVTPDEKNTKKAIITRSQLEISFDDEKKILRFATPGGHMIEMDDDSGSISIQDSNDNSVKLSSSGISISSAKDLTLSAKSSITVDAGTSLELKAKTDASIRANQVTAKATTKFSASSSAAAELKSTGILTVRGSLVNIN